MSHFKKLSLPAWLLVVAMLLHFALFVSLGLAEHDSLRTFFDLTDLSQATWNTLQGRPFALSNTEGVTSRLGIHVELIIVLVAPFYLIYNDARTLIVLQTVCLTLAAWPIYVLAKDIFARSNLSGLAACWAALTIALMYLLHPAVGGSSMQLLNFVVWATPFLAAAFLMLRRRQFKWFWLFAVLVMLCKEDVPLLVALMGVYALIVLREWKQGIAVIVVALGYFYVANYVILPTFSPAGQSIFLKRYGVLGDTLTQVILSPFTRPRDFLDVALRERNFTYLWHSFAATGFLNLFEPITLFLSSPTLAINLLSDFPPNQEPDIYYTVPLVPFWLAGTATVMAFILRFAARRQWNVRYVVGGLCAFILVSAGLNHLAVGRSPIGGYYVPPEVTPHTLRAESFRMIIPETASLSAHPFLNPHYSTREKLYIFPRMADAEYALLDVTTENSMHPNDLRASIADLLANGYGIAAARDGYIVLRHGEANKTLPDAFYDFARVTHPQPQYGADFTFGDSIKLIGYDLVAMPRDTTLLGGRKVQARFYWQVLRAPDKALRLYPFFYNDEGQIIEDTSLRVMIATVWYPPQQWRAGEIIRTDMWPWNIGDEFHLGVGIVEGKNWDAKGRRLPVSGGDATHHARDGTWVSLGDYRWEGKRLKAAHEK